MKVPSRSEMPRPADTQRAERPCLVLAQSETRHGMALHARLAPTVNRLVWTFLGADPDREDIAQDVFMRLLRGAPRLRDAEKLEPWAIRVAMNCIRNHFRRRRLWRWVSWDTEEDPDRVPFHPDFAGRELLRRTYQVLNKLPVRERLPLMLRLFENAPIGEIAELCDCSIRTTKRRLKAARSRFESLARRDPLLRSRLIGCESDARVQDD